jgi:glycyl-tRNA synthetase
MAEKNNDDRMEKIISLTKRRGFVFQGSEIYGGLAGTWDYGPRGIEMKKAIESHWWNTFVTKRPDIFGLDASILMNRAVWEASGHAEGFADPLVEDIKTKKRYRADHLLEEAGVDRAEALNPAEMTAKINELQLKSPDGNDLGEVQQFNMMFSTMIGASEESRMETFLRPETAQGIFVNYKNIIDTMRPKVPFGIAQIGKAFRNEITPRDWIFRVRELEQMEIEFFVRPEDASTAHNAWKDLMWQWGIDMNTQPKNVHIIPTLLGIYSIFSHFRILIKNYLVAPIEPTMI